ncbi:dihydrofolate reductase [Pedobacter sp. P351]|uniref:dipeptidyl-peptidase 3 family protein n=1 Tax=Pedobacter superstes TaxID=3133441 RepID=UPI003099EEBD
MRYRNLFFSALSIGCLNISQPTVFAQTKSDTKPFTVTAEAFADLQILRYQVPGFDELSLQQKKLAYYLSEAALSGRDIIYDQSGKYNLLVRKTIENIYSSYKGDRTSQDWQKFKTYAGRFWFSNGMHHHYGNEKFIPEHSFAYFNKLVLNSNLKAFPLNKSETVAAFLSRIRPIIFDPKFQPKLVDLSPNTDNVVASSNNFYEGVSQKEVEHYYAQFDTKGNAPSWGLNTKVLKQNGKVIEKTWKIGGMYSSAIEKIVYWLEKAIPVAENAEQKDALQKLVKYYRSGDLKDFDEYSIAWVNDTKSRLDVVNGFIEVYKDAIGKKGSFESVVSLKDIEATKRLEAIAKEAQWFEDNSPLKPEHKKKQVKGITAKAITVIMESGDASPSTPIGINLPNADWIRKEHGSKSVSLSNIVHAYNLSSANSGVLDEFAFDPAVKSRIRQYGNLSSDLHTDMHECIGHASGQINPGVQNPDKTLKNYASALEEARADLVALYYIMDPKLIEIGVMPTLEVGKAEYDSYIMNGLITQLTRLKPGDNLEEAHMRNRQLNAMWVYEKGKAEKVIEFVKQNGKTYTKINDYNKLRTLFGDLLREIQRVKSEGDFEAGKSLIETYGVKVDQELLKEVLARYAKLNVKPYKGFIQPKLIPVLKGTEITDVKVTYPTSFYQQMMEYGKNYSYLPVMN